MLLIPILAPFNTLAEGPAASFEKDLDLAWGVWQWNADLFHHRMKEIDTKASDSGSKENNIVEQGAWLLKRDLRTTEERQRGDITTRRGLRGAVESMGHRV